MNFTQGTSTILNPNVLAETFYHGFITFYAYAPCTFIVNIYYAALVNTTHGFYWRWDVLHAKWHGYP